MKRQRLQLVKGQLTDADIEYFVDAVMNGPTIKRASSLFLLVKLASDSQVRETALRAIAPQTTEYEAWISSMMREAV